MSEFDRLIAPYVMERTTIPATGGGYYQRLNVTPGLAKEILDKYQIPNRPVSNAIVMKYNTAAINNEWVAESALIKFSKAKQLFDGQHRLWMIIKSGISQVFLCKFNCEKSEVYVTDMGKRRSQRDHLSVATEKLVPHREAELLDKILTGVHNTSQTKKNITTEQRNSYFIKYLPDIKWVNGTFINSVRGVARTGIRAAWVRARIYDIGSSDKLVKAAAILFSESGSMPDRASAIGALRKYVREAPINKSDQLDDNYRKANGALYLYLNGQTVADWRDLDLPGREENFPIPSDHLFD